MTTKACFKCLCVKPLEAFYKHARMRDGHLNKCMDCTKRDSLAHRLENIDKYRSYDRMRASMPHRVAQAKRCFQNGSWHTRSAAPQTLRLATRCATAR